MSMETLDKPAVAPHPELALSPEEFEKLPLEARICAQLVHNPDLHAYVTDLGGTTDKIVEAAKADHGRVTDAMRRLLGATEHRASFTKVDESDEGKRMVPTQAGLDFLHREIDKLR